MRAYIRPSSSQGQGLGLLDTSATISTMTVGKAKHRIHKPQPLRKRQRTTHGAFPDYIGWRMPTHVKCNLSRCDYAMTRQVVQDDPAKANYMDLDYVMDVCQTAWKGFLGRKWVK